MPGPLDAVRTGRRMNRPTPLDRQLAELYGKYVRLPPGPERHRLGEALDRLAALVLTPEDFHAKQPVDRVAP